ncbi:MAG TPA: ATP-grasp domain-containing protein [Chitinophagales bacterium]|nr:ATP-grasp domain-containing protein [Chitinophagales bacterium]
MKIIISDSPSYKCIVVARFIKCHYPAIEIVTFSDKALSKWLHTKYSDRHILINSHPVSNPEGYIAELKDIVEKEKPDLFFPVNSEEINLLIQKIELFGKSLAYWGDYDTFQLLNEKDNLHQLASGLGINVPQRYKDLSEAQVPFIIKPVHSSASKGIRYVFTENDRQILMKQKLEKGNCIIQQYIEGEGAGFSVFAVKGEIKSSFGHKRLFEYPVSGGSSVYREKYFHPAMKPAAETILRETRWSGFAMFEFKVTAANEAYLIEVNPRIWGSINEGLQNGVNYFEYLLGPEKNPLRITGEVKTYLSPLFFLSLMRYVLRGDFGKPAYYFKHLFRSRPDVSFFSDPKGWLSLLLKAI